MSEPQNKTSRGLEEVSHFFLSQRCQDNHQLQNPAVSPLYFEESHKDLKACIAETFADFTEASSGCLIIDHHNMICFANPKARKLLSTDDQQLVGQLFNYSIEENKTLLISILYRNGKWGVGEMHVKPTKWQGEKAYLVSIKD